MPWHGKKNSRRAVTLAPSPGQRHTAEDGAFARGLTYLRDRWLRRRAAERRQNRNVAFEEELPPSCLVQIRDWFSKKTQQVADSRILCCLQRRKQWSTKVHPFQEASQNPGSSADKHPTTSEENVAEPPKAEVKPTVVNLGTGPIIHESPSPDAVILNDDLDIVSVASDEEDIDSDDKEIQPKDALVPKKVKNSSKIRTYPFGPSNSPGTSVDGPEFDVNVTGVSGHAPASSRNVDGTSVDPPVTNGSTIGTSVGASGTNPIVVGTSRYGDGPSTSRNVGAPSQGGNATEQQLVISTAASATGDAPSTSAAVAVGDPFVSQAINRIGEVMSNSEMFQRMQNRRNPRPMEHPDRFLVGLNSPRRLTPTPTRNTESPDSVERTMRRCVYATIEMAMDIAIANKMKKGQAAALVYRQEEAMELHAEEQALIMEICERRELEWQSGVQQHVERTQLGIEQERHLEEMRGRQSVLREELARSESRLAERSLEVESRPASRYTGIPSVIVPRPGEGGSSPTVGDVERGVAEGIDGGDYGEGTKTSQKSVSSPRSRTSPSPASSSDMVLADKLSPESSSSFEELKGSVASYSTTPENKEEPPAEPPTSLEVLEESVASRSTTSEDEEEPTAEPPSSFEELQESVASCSTTSGDEEGPPGVPPSSFEELQESVASCSTTPGDEEGPPAVPPSSFEELEESVASCSTTSENEEEPPAEPPRINERPKTAKTKKTQQALETAMEQKSGRGEDVGRKTMRKRPVTAKRRSTSAFAAKENSVRPRSASQPCSSKINSPKDVDGKTAKKVLPTSNGIKSGGDRPSTSKGERKVSQANLGRKSVKFTTTVGEPPTTKPSTPKGIQSSRIAKAKSTRPATPMPRGLATTTNGSPKPAFTKSPLASNPKSAWSNVAKVPRPGTPIPGPGNPMPPSPRPAIKKSPLASNPKSAWSNAAKVPRPGTPIPGPGNPMPPASKPTVKKSPLAAETKSPTSTTTQAPIPPTVVDETATTHHPAPSDKSTGSVGSKADTRGRKPSKSPASSTRARSPKVSRAKFPTPVRCKSPFPVRDKRGQQGRKVKHTTAKVRPQTAQAKSSLKRSSTSTTKSRDSAKSDGVGGDKEDGEKQKHAPKEKPVKTVNFAQRPDVRYFAEKVYLASESDSSDTGAEYSDDFESDSDESGDF